MTLAQEYDITREGYIVRQTWSSVDSDVESLLIGNEYLPSSTNLPFQLKPETNYLQG